MKWIIRLCLLVFVLKLLESYLDFQQFRQLYRTDKVRTFQPRRYSILEIESMDWSASP